VYVCSDLQMIRVCVTLLPSCPLLLLSKPNSDEDIILGVAYMPKVSVVLLSSKIRSVSIMHLLFRFRIFGFILVKILLIYPKSMRAHVFSIGQ